jgi:osmotically-inducible protein OsmY
MRHALTTSVATLAVCGILITGCDSTASRDGTSPTTTTTTATASPSAGSAAERDNAISSVIHNHLEVDKDISYTGKMISITTTNGVVLLNGTVHNEGDHQKILATVRKVDGVERIDDRILIQ